jgi:hypothetical protein
LIALDRKIARERSTVTRRTRQEDTTLKKSLGGLVFLGDLGAETPLVVLGALLSAHEKLISDGDAFRAKMQELGDRRFDEQRQRPLNRSAHLTAKERLKRLIVCGGNVVAAGLQSEPPAILLGISIAASEVLSRPDADVHRERYQRAGHKHLFAKSSPQVAS